MTLFDGDFKGGQATLLKETKNAHKKETDETASFEIDFTLADLTKKFNKPGMEGLLMVNCELDPNLLIHQVSYLKKGQVKVANKILKDGRLGNRQSETQNVN